MKKIEMGGDFLPSLRPFEVKWCMENEEKKFNLISEPRSVETKFTKDKDYDATVIDVKLPKIPDKDVYLDEGTQKEDRESRLESPERSWFANASSVNKIVEEHGKNGEIDDEDVKGLKVELIVHKQKVFEQMKSIIYVKGAEPQDD